MHKQGKGRKARRERKACRTGPGVEELAGTWSGPGRAAGRSRDRRRARALAPYSIIPSTPSFTAQQNTGRSKKHAKTHAGKRGGRRHPERGEARE
jgi:hypothetical protein